MTPADGWDDHLDALDAWVSATVEAARSGGHAPDAPRGGPLHGVPPRLRLRALALLARIDDAERSVAAQRSALERERVYST